MSELWKDNCISNLVSEIVNGLGYSLQMVNLCRKRICHFNQLLCTSGKVNRVTGSTAEGISKFCESDIDILSSFRDIISTTTGDNSKHLLLDRRDCPPGYTRLSFLRDDFFEDYLPYLQNSIIIYEEKNYLGSTAWKSAFKGESSSVIGTDFGILNRSKTTRGPSNSETLIYVSGICKGFRLEFDSVCGIICDCPDILQSWIDRPRNFWPPYEVTRDISQMEAYVVPVGHVTSDMQDIEWRICFTRAEQRLVVSFNDCQIKLLVLLKMICKTYLRPLCEEMTSYQMKNVVYWALDKLPDTFFEDDNLLKAVEFALISLRNFIRINNLPNYMIPQRNLLADKVHVSERDQLCLRIESLLRDGPQILLGCDKIGTAVCALNSCPRDFFAFSQFQLLVELNLFSVMARTDLPPVEIFSRFDIMQVREAMLRYWRLCHSLLF